MSLVSFDDFTEDPVPVFNNPANADTGDARLADDQTFTGHNTFTENVVIAAPQSIQVGETGDGEVNWYRIAADTWETTNEVRIAGGDLVIYGTGNGIKIKEGGANARMGRATLVAGTVVVATTAVTAISEIFLTSQVTGGTPGFLRVNDRTAGTSFTIVSGDSSDTSVVAWLILEPTA